MIPELGSVYGTSVELLLRIAVAALLGALVGFERERCKRPAGLRTNMLVCIGACLFTVVSANFTVNPAIIAAGVVTGVGFLGAGSIIGNGKNKQGVTTAATLWVVAGVGLALGAGEYVLAIVTAVIVFFILLMKEAEVGLRNKIK